MLALIAVIIAAILLLPSCGSRGGKAAADTESTTLVKAGDKAPDFTVEMFGDEAEALRRAGGEYGAATGRPRRVGAFDIPASRYGVRMHGADCIALTKMDVLSYMDKIPVCVAYDINGEITEKFPVGERLNAAKPVFEYMEGFGDISGCRKPEDLPKAAMDYIRYLEAAVGCKIKYVSVGAGRDEYVEL